MQLLSYKKDYFILLSTKNQDGLSSTNRWTLLLWFFKNFKNPHLFNRKNCFSTLVQKCGIIVSMKWPLQSISNGKPSPGNRNCPADILLVACRNSQYQFFGSGKKKASIGHQREAFCSYSTKNWFKAGNVGINIRRGWPGSEWAFPYLLWAVSAPWMWITHTLYCSVN